MARDSSSNITKYEDPPSEEDHTLSDEDDEQGGASGEQLVVQDDSDDHSDAEDEHDAQSEASSVRSVKKTTQAYDEADSEDEDFDVPARKKARRASGSTNNTTKKAKGKGSSKAGKLEYFQSMPLDVLCEIAGHLDPLTLLSMSRVSKPFRALFLSKSSKSIWHLARRNVFLPDLQADDMSEAAYASLVFERNCMVCGKGRASIVDYFIRARWCRKCKKANLIAQNSFRALRHPQTLACMPFTLVSLTGQNRSQRHYFFKQATLKLDAQLVQLQAAVDAAAAKDGSSVKAKGKGKGKQKAVVEDDEDEDAESPQAVLRAFIEARKEIVANATADGTAIFNWERSSAAERRTSNADLRTQRRNAIKQKVIALGHEERDCEFYLIANLVDQPRPLTDAIWNKISGAVIAQAVRNAERRLAQEEGDRQRLRARLVGPLHQQMLDAAPAGVEKATFPTLGVFVGLPSVQQHWKPKQPDGYTIDQGAWLASLDDILAEVEQRKKEDKTRYCMTIVRALRDANVPVPNLKQLIDKGEAKWDHDNSRAIPPTITDEEMDSVFAHSLARMRCAHGPTCSSSYGYPEIRVHEHSQHNGATHMSFTSVKWIQAMRKMVEQAGLDEAKFEESQLEALGEVWECRGCKAEGTRAYTPWGQPPAPLVPVQKTKLAWGALVSHAFKHHNSYYRYNSRGYFGSYREKPPKLTMMGVGEDEADSEELEKSAEAGPSSYTSGSISDDFDYMFY